MKQIRRFGLLGLATTVAILAVHYWPLWESAIAPFFDRDVLTAYFLGAGPIEIVIFVCAHVFANAIGVPGTLLVVVGGAVFGLWWGTLWSVIGATLGAIAAFTLARYFFYDWFRQRFEQRPILQKLNRALTQNALSCVLTVRFSPVSPFNVVNFAFGLTPIPLRPYAIGTFLGIVPGTLIYTWLGASGVTAMTTGEHWSLILCLLCMMILSIAPLSLRHLRKSNKIIR